MKLFMKLSYFSDETENRKLNGEKRNKWREISSGALRAWRLRRQRHIRSSCDSLNLLALHHARLLSHSGAAAAFGRGTADDAACGRAGASGAALRVLRTHCGAAESGFIGGRRRLGRALYPPTDARFE